MSVGIATPHVTRYFTTMSRDLAAASARILNAYRRRILLGKVVLPFAEARRLVGPDCAYHLYFRHRATNAQRSRRKAQRK